MEAGVWACSKNAQIFAMTAFSSNSMVPTVLEPIEISSKKGCNQTQNQELKWISFWNLMWWFAQCIMVRCVKQSWLIDHCHFHPTFFASFNPHWHLRLRFNDGGTPLGDSEDVGEGHVHPTVHLQSFEMHWGPTPQNQVCNKAASTWMNPPKSCSNLPPFGGEENPFRLPFVTFPVPLPSQDPSSVVLHVE